MFLIQGAVKEYDWGIINGLTPWTGMATNGPQAELWFGVHPSGPSRLVSDGSTLDQHLSREDAPILAKILAAARPLSVQVHPTAVQAREGWSRQQGTRSASDDAEKNRDFGEPVLADPFEKAEVLVAMDEFSAFAGWRPIDEAASILERLPSLVQAAATLRDHGRAAAIRRIIEVHQAVRDNSALVPRAVLEAASSGRWERPEKPGEIAAYQAAATEFPGDVGVALAVLLGYLRLQPGEAVYLPPGVPHSYVRGLGFEAMTSSDNVLRLGLTSKTVNVEAALEILDFDGQPQILEGGDEVSPRDAAFYLVPIDGNEVALSDPCYRLIVALRGDVEVASGDHSVVAGKGLGVAVLSSEGPVVVRTSGKAMAVCSRPEGAESRIRP